MVKNSFSKYGIHHFLFMTSIIMLLLFAGCTGSHSSKSSRHRSPASTGHRKCGCSMLNPSAIHTFEIYQPSGYALQA